METQNPNNTRHNLDKINMSLLNDKVNKEQPNCTDVEKSTKPVLKKKKRCFYNGCKKKITLVDFPCKCEHIFCSLHRLPENHECTFDHRQSALNNLSKKLVKVVADKVTKI